MINTATAMETVNIKSSMPLGSGTMMIIRIAITKTTMLRSRCFKMALRELARVMVFALRLANSYSSMMSLRVKPSKKVSILPCKRLRKGQILQVEALSEGQSFSELAQSKTAGVFPSAAHMIWCTVMVLLSRARAKPPLTPL